MREKSAWNPSTACAADGGGPASQLCELYFQIIHAGKVLARAESDFLTPYGLNPARLILLALLDEAENGCMRSSELAEKAEVSRATITGLLDTLERSGWIARAIDPHDRRSFTIKITPSGEHLLQKVCPQTRKWAARAVSALDIEEIHHLSLLLGKLLAAFPAQQDAE